MVTYILLGVGVVVLLYIVLVFNKIAKRKNQIQNAISSLDSLFIQRAELIPNLIETTKQYMNYEQETLAQITELRTPVVTEKQNPYLQPEKGNKMLMNVMARAEEYPELKANTPKHSPSSQKAHTETKAQATRRRKQPARDTIQGASLFDFTDEAGQAQVVPTTEYREVFDTSPRPFLSAPDSHLRDGSIVVQKGQVGYLSDLKRRPTFHPMDLPIAQLTRLRAYIEIRESYHRLYDYEATNHAEDKEEREKLNRLYDAYVARWGELNKKANTDVIKMDATGLEMLFLERSIDGHFVKADIFDHPTAFSSDELSIASDPLEALGASLNKYGSVELAFMASLLPEMEDNDIISALEGRIYFNPEAGG